LTFQAAQSIYYNRQVPSRANILDFTDLTCDRHSFRPFLGRFGPTHVCRTDDGNGIWKIWRNHRQNWCNDFTVDSIWVCSTGTGRGSHLRKAENAVGWGKVILALKANGFPQ
jgi:hypothetical protein